MTGLDKRMLAFGGLFAAVALGAVTSVAVAENETEGGQLFEQRCAACHNERGFGTRVLSRRVPEGEAQLQNRTEISAPFVIAVVRRGIGSMPQIREAELSDAELDLIAAYLEEKE